MAPNRRRTPGLLLRRGIWHIDKIIYGKRICESTRTGDRIEAEALLARRVTQARHVHVFGEPCEHSFREAATKFLAENQLHCAKSDCAIRDRELPGQAL
jgi:hypothetical protein